MTVRIKICANTNLEDALLAEELGADALGFIFDKNSPRYITPQNAKDIIVKLPPFITNVGVFVNEPESAIRHLLDEVPLEVLQFHGAETPEYCSQFKRPYIKVIHMNANLDFNQIATEYHEAQALLLDTSHPTLAGGTGQAFNWHWIPKIRSKAIILAGGLTPQNINQAIAEVKPEAVDVVSGVESSPGKKDKHKLSLFIANIKGNHHAKNSH